MKIPDSPISILTRELTESAAGVKYARMLLLRRLRKIATVQKTVAATDPAAERLSEEIVTIMNAMSGTLDKSSKGLIRPPATTEGTADADAVMAELLGGGRKLV
jgi:hypothetical protein